MRKQIINLSDFLSSFPTLWDFADRSMSQRRRDESGDDHLLNENFVADWVNIVKGVKNHKNKPNSRYTETHSNTRASSESFTLQLFYAEGNKFFCFPFLSVVSSIPHRRQTHAPTLRTWSMKNKKLYLVISIAMFAFFFWFTIHIKWGTLSEEKETLTGVQWWIKKIGELFSTNQGQTIIIKTIWLHLWALLFTQHIKT